MVLYEIMKRHINTMRLSFPKESSSLSNFTYAIRFMLQLIFLWLRFGLLVGYTIPCGLNWRWRRRSSLHFWKNYVSLKRITFTLVSFDKSPHFRSIRLSVAPIVALSFQIESLGGGTHRRHHHQHDCQVFIVFTWPHRLVSSWGSLKRFHRTIPTTGL